MAITKKFLTKITKKHCMEFGQVATLVILFLALRYKNDQLITAAFGLLLASIVLPIILYPFAVVWFALSELLSIVSPPIILTIIFFLVVIPVGLIRRLLGKDSMRLKQFKKSKQSVMIERDHLYTGADLLHTF
ncbi:MAG: hypothetical protein JWP44_3522 [Mucilaginibacter sp.]|nr:hypothetical protein [Mucilaginibacter sp.]